MNEKIKKVIFLLTYANSSVKQIILTLNIHNQPEESYENIG